MSLSPTPSGAPEDRRSPARLERQLSSAKSILKAMIGLLGMLPPLVVVVGLIDIDPGMKRLVEIVMFTVSIVAIMAIISQGNRISRWSTNRAILIFGSCAVAGAAAGIFYLLFAEAHVFSYKDTSYVIPITPSDEMRQIIEPWGNQYEEALRYSPRSDRLHDLLIAERGPAVIAMIGLMVACQLLLIIAILGSVWKLVVDWSEDEDPPAPQAT